MFTILKDFNIYVKKRMTSPNGRRSTKLEADLISLGINPFEQYSTESISVSGPCIIEDTSWTEQRSSAIDAEAQTYISLSSLDMDIRTIRRRIEKFLEPDDYVLTKKGNRVIFNIDADMIGYITRRLY